MMKKSKLSLYLLLLMLSVFSSGVYADACGEHDIRSNFGHILTVNLPYGSGINARCINVNCVTDGLKKTVEISSQGASAYSAAVMQGGAKVELNKAEGDEMAQLSINPGNLACEFDRSKPSVTLSESE